MEIYLQWYLHHILPEVYFLVIFLLDGSLTIALCDLSNWGYATLMQVVQARFVLVGGCLNCCYG